MKIAAIKNYTGKGYTSNFGRKDEKKDTKSPVSLPQTNRASISKMLPVMLAMAGMQPTSAGPSDQYSIWSLDQYSYPSSQYLVWPDIDTSITPQYDESDPMYYGRSKYMFMNLNELYFYTYNSMYPPKGLDLNEIFDSYMDGKMNWERLKYTNKFSDFDMSKIQNAIAYYKDLYDIRQYERKDAKRRGEPDPYPPEVLAAKPIVRAKYQDIIGDFISSYYGIGVEPGDTRLPESAEIYLSYTPYSAHKKLEEWKEKEKHPEKFVVDPDNFPDDNDILKYRGNPEDVVFDPINTHVLPANYIAAPAIMPNSAEAANNVKTKSSSQTHSQVNKKEQAKVSSSQTYLPETVAADEGVVAREARFVKDLYTDFQNLILGKNVDPKYFEVFEQNNVQMKYRAKCNNFSTLLNIAAADSNCVYVSGVLQTTENSSNPGRKMQIFAKTDGQGSLDYALFKDEKTNKAYAAVMSDEKQLSVFDFTKDAEDVSLAEFGSAIEDAADEAVMYESSEDAIDEDDLSYFEEVAAIDMRNKIREKTFDEAMKMQEYYSLDDVIETPDELEIAEEKATTAVDHGTVAGKPKPSTESKNIEFKTYSPAETIEFAKLLEARQNEEKNKKAAEKDLPILFVLTAVGGAAAGIGGKKLVDSLKARNISFKEVMNMVKQKLSDIHSSHNAQKKKHSNVDDPKKAFWG